VWADLENTMQHPHSRSERRYAREIWRNHRRKIIFTRYTSRSSDPTENSGWLKGGKQYFACGNRCGHCIMQHNLERKELKSLRRKIFD
jgi:hypothetical protein